LTESVPRRISGPPKSELVQRSTKSLSQLDSSLAESGPGPGVERPGLRLRQTERGILATPTRLTFCLRFENFPVWLLALESIFVSNLIILGTHSPTELKRRIAALGASTALLASALTNLQASDVRYTERLAPTPDSILLVSGSLPFIRSWSLQAQGPVLVLCDEHVRQRQVIDSHLRWSQLRHVTFGGLRTSKLWWAPTSRISNPPEHLYDGHWSTSLTTVSSLGGHPLLALKTATSHSRIACIPTTSSARCATTPITQERVGGRDGFRMMNLVLPLDGRLGPGKPTKVMPPSHVCPSKSWTDS
jgi:hypothetical protein